MTIYDIKAPYKKSDSKSSLALKNLKEKLDCISKHQELEVDQVIELIEHDYSLAPILEVVVYYLTGYF